MSLTLIRQTFFAIFDKASGQFYHWKGDSFSGTYSLGPVDEASRFDTAKAAMAEAAEINGPYEIRKCSVTWKMSTGKLS